MFIQRQQLLLAATIIFAITLVASVSFTSAIPSLHQHRSRRASYTTSITFPNVNFYSWLLFDTSYRSVDFYTAFGTILYENNVAQANQIESFAVSTNFPENAAIITVSCKTSAVANAIHQFINSSSIICVPIKTVKYNLCTSGNHFYDPINLSSTPSTTTVGHGDGFGISTVSGNTEESSNGGLSNTSTLIIIIAGACVVVILVVGAIAMAISKRSRGGPASDSRFSHSDFASSDGTSFHTAFSSALSGTSFDMGTIGRRAKLGIFADEKLQGDAQDHSSLYRHSVVNAMRTLSGKFERGENGEFRKAGRKSRDKLRMDMFNVPPQPQPQPHQLQLQQGTVSVVDGVAYDIADYYSETGSTGRSSRNANPLTSVEPAYSDETPSSQNQTPSAPILNKMLNVKSSGNLLHGKAQSNANHGASENGLPTSISLERHIAEESSTENSAHFSPPHEYLQLGEEIISVEAANSPKQIKVHEVISAVHAQEAARARTSPSNLNNRLRYSVSILSNRSSFSSNRVLDNDPYDWTMEEEEEEEGNSDEEGDFGKFNFLSGQYLADQKEKKKSRLSYELQHQTHSPRHY
eukprot:m.31054 g.31054  ORF g.31054 m.31054 type:complete len:580 (+) comp6273_c2_seq1:1261-3000(+)